MAFKLTEISKVIFGVTKCYLSSQTFFPPYNLNPYFTPPPLIYFRKKNNKKITVFPDYKVLFLEIKRGSFNWRMDRKNAIYTVEFGESTWKTRAAHLRTPPNVMFLINEFNIL